MSQTNEIAEKIDELTKEIELDPQNADLYWQRSLFYLPEKKYPQAIADCTKAIKLDPQNKLHYSFRAVNYALVGRLDKAIYDYTKCIELNPNDVESYESRKECYAEMGNFDKAIEDLEQLDQLDFWDDPYQYFEERESLIEMKNKQEKDLARVGERNKVIADVNTQVFSDEFALDRIKEIYEAQKDEANKNKILEMRSEFQNRITEAKLEERNRIIRNQAHDIKNILSSIISPLMYLQRRIHKPQIEQALKQVDVLSKMVNATSLSYSGSPEDFFYNAQNNAKGISLREMIVTSVESSLANIVEDIDYYAIFREQYLP